MKLSNLFESAFDDQAGWDYLYRDCLIEMHRTKFNEFLRSKEGKAAKYKALAFVEKQGSYFKEEFLSDNQFLEKVTFSGNILNSPSSVEFYHYDELGGPPPFKIGELGRDFSVQSGKTLTEIPEWFPTKCRRLQLDRTGITSLHNIHKVVKECQLITINHCPVSSSIVGLMLIKNLQKVEFGVTDEMVNSHPVDGAYYDLETIIRKNLEKNPRDAFEFQDDLIDAGWEEYAKL